MDRKEAITQIRNEIAQESRAKRIFRDMRRRLKAEHRAGHECACQRKHNAISDDMRDSRCTLRALHLVLAYLRGREYRRVEQKCRTGNAAWQKYGLAHDMASKLQDVLGTTDKANIEQHKEDWRIWLSRVQDWAKVGAPADLSEPARLVRSAA